MSLPALTMAEDAGEDAESDTVSSIIPFLDFVNLLERVSNAKKEEKATRIKAYFERYRKKFRQVYGSLDPNVGHGDSIFSIVRLLCPSWDRERSSYGIKDHTMGRIFAKIHKISQHDSDGKQLYNYKNPSIVGSLAAGDIALVIHSVLSTRSSHSDPSKSPTISELHSVLDQLAKNKDGDESKVTQDEQVTILQGFVQRIGALEGKWLAKIILKKMDLGINETAILNLVHPKAKDLLDTMSLLRVCQVCNDPDNVDVPTGTVSLFSYFKPMLCLALKLQNSERGGDNAEKVICSGSKKNPMTLPPAPFLVETKFDGERFQIHYQRGRGAVGKEHVFKYFSRGGFEFKEFNNTLTPRLQKQISPTVDSFVIDGEMMAYNYKNKSFTAKGKSMDVKTLLEGDMVHCPAYVAWDLVFLNGESLCHKPLTTRVGLLQKVATAREAVYYVSDQEKCEDMSGVIQLLDRAVENCEEGVVIKHQHSVYEPGQRKSTWLKLKPEYVDGYRLNDLDLLIVGGYYADTMRRGGTITSLVLGLLDGQDVYPVTRVGCGRLKHHEMASLVESLQPHFVTTDVPCIKFKGKRPDVVIHPRNSVVLEVNASEINQSKDYLINYALRFPVISKIRRDKPWDDAMTVADFHQLRQSCKQGKMVKRKPADNGPGPYKRSYWGSPIKFEKGSSDEESRRYGNHQKPSTSKASAAPAAKKQKTVYVSPKKIMETRAKAIEESNRLAAPQEESNLFQGKIFNVSGSAVWQNDVSQKLKRNGGEVYMNPNKETFAIVAEKMTELVKRKMATGKWEILNGTTWIDKCIAEQRVLDFVPMDLLYVTDATKESFSKDFDPFGDSFTQQLTIPEVKELLEKVISGNSRQENIENFQHTKDSLRRHIRRVDKGFPKWSFFKKCKVGFFPKMDFGYKALLEFYGGKLVEDWKSPEVTHLIIAGQGPPETPSRAPLFLQGEWIQDCIKKRELIDTVPYQVIVESVE